MQTTELRRKGLVLRLSEFKEADAMVNAISSDGFFSFLARGVKKLTSKNASSVQPFSLSEFLLMQSNSGGLTLKQGTLEENYQIENSIEAMTVLSFLQELTLKVVQEDEAPLAYPYLIKAISSIKEGKDPLTIGLLYFAKVLNNAGYGLDVDECVVCHKKQSIVALSYEEGGFLCKDHYETQEDEKPDLMKLKIVRYLFRCKESDFPRVEFERKDTIPLYDELGRYLENLTGCRLKSLSLIKSL